MNRLTGSLAFAALIASALLPRLDAVQVPFVLPWDDGAPGPTDLSAWNKPIGSNDWVTVTPDGHFAVQGERIRFIGMNFAIDSPFQPTNKADAVAARLAKYGFNCVRFHHMDPSWALGGGLIQYSKGNSRSLNPAQLDKVHYLVSRLKAHGVYANMNLLVSREFKAADGLPAEVASLGWKDQHILGFFNDTALALHKEYATDLLTATNRYTGLPLAKDPAVAFVEIQNENGIIQKWFDGVLETLPAVFANQLIERWNTWLAARYAGDAELQAGWNVIDQPLGANLVRNGTFTNALTGWNQEQHEVAKATFTATKDFDGKPSARIAVTTPGTQAWHIQFNQPGLSVKAAAPYTVTFWAKASEAVAVDVSVMEAHGPNYAGLGYSQRAQLTTNWQEFKGSFQATATDSNARPNFGGFATQKVTVWLADVRVQPGGQLGMLPPGVSLAARNVPILPHAGQGGAYTLDARKDWVRFLTALEQRYWSAMAEHVRQACGYPGLVFGTIIANSPPNVQAALDVVDGHAYWQHPQFPVKDWDPVNWLVGNVSMVNSPDGTTLGGLACQRVQGKPFTVTEYQHAAPNYYGAEGPLLMGAYGALQDWDGFWWFDYGQGNDLDKPGNFHGFFDTAHHTTKLANMLLAAGLFRRGDARPAVKEYTMKFTPEIEVDTVARKGGAWNVANASHLGLPGKLGFASRLSMSVGANATGLTTAPAAPTGAVIASDTGELRWDNSVAGKGVVTINTPRTKAVSGFSDGKTYNLSGIVLRPGATQLGWSTIGFMTTQGESLTNGGTALLIACGQVDNTGMQWQNAEKTSLGTAWGTAPILAEVVPFTLTLPVAPERVKVTILDQRGRRREDLPVGVTNGMAQIVIGTNTASIWYEIKVSGDTAFERWRFRHFTPAQLEDPALTGPWVSAAGDGTPNFVRHALGLAPLEAATNAPAHAALTTLGNDRYLSLTYTRAKDAADVLYQPEVSPDLGNWYTGPDRVVEENLVDQGEHLQVTARDLAPLSQASQGYLRLQILPR